MTPDLDAYGFQTKSAETIETQPRWTRVLFAKRPKFFSAKQSLTALVFRSGALAFDGFEMWHYACP